MIVTQESLQGEIPVEGARVVCLDADWQRIEREPLAALDVRSSPELGVCDLHVGFHGPAQGGTGHPRIARELPELRWSAAGVFRP